MYEHMVLSGGSSMYPGMPSRLEKEIRRLYLDVVLKGNKEQLRKLKLKIEDPPRRKHMVYLGAAVLADIMRDKPDFWISKAEWCGRTDRGGGGEMPFRRSSAPLRCAALRSRCARASLALSW